MDCDQDGKLLMPKINHLETLWTAVPRKVLGALLVHSRLHPVTPPEWDTSQSILKSVGITWADLLETQPSPTEKSPRFEMSISLNLKGIFMIAHVCEPVQNIIFCYCDCNSKFFSNHSVNTKLTSD